MNKKDTLRRILSLLKGHRPSTVGTVIFSALGVVCTLEIPVLVGIAIDSVAGQGNVDFKAVNRALVLIAIFTLSGAVSQWIKSILNNRITYDIIHDLRDNAFKKLMRVPVSYIDSNKQGETVSRIITDTDTFADGLLLGFTQLFTGIATIIGTLIFMFTMSPAITLAVVVLTPASLFMARFIAKRTLKMFKLQSETRARQTALVDEMISGEKTLKAFSYEQTAEKNFEAVNKDLADCSLKATFYSSLTNPCTRFVNALVYACVALFGALSVLGGGLSVGMLVSFLSYANQYSKPFNEISGVIAEFQNAVACAARIFELLDAEEMSFEPDNNGGFVPKGNIDFNKVTFSYTPEQKLITDFSANIKSGQKIAIVGPTGCGKTTLINLLERFYDPVSGEILIDGVSTADLPRSAVRSSFGMVLQETWLKSGSVSDNLKMGKPDATDFEMKDAARITKADSFIRRLPQGYDTKLGEGGGSLSEGQKQLLCITRVMLMNPPMLILDEATSSIDTLTERIVQSAFLKLMEGKTTFVVAHRLSTIVSSDLILVMKDGNIIERGTHDTLLEKKGFYAELYNSQFEK